jgi:tRNA dimethylallyltransferase
MTWFRGMERRGVKIKWINVDIPLDERLEIVEDMIRGQKWS